MTDKLKALALAATPGPWIGKGVKECGYGWVYAPNGGLCTFGKPVEILKGQYSKQSDDAAYIAAASPDAILALIKAKEYAEAERDANAARLDWIQRHLFGHKWNGVIDSGSQTRWDIWSGYRHETQHLIGNTFAEAIDNAIAKKGQTHD